MLFRSIWRLIVVLRENSARTGAKETVINRFYIPTQETLRTGTKVRGHREISDGRGRKDDGRDVVEETRSSRTLELG